MKTQFLASVILLATSLPVVPASEAGSSTPQRLDYMLVVTGEELLRGAFPDAHTCFITRTLHLLGCHCVGSMAVDDRAEDIQSALHYATNRARLVIVTGGLGPTVNDVTRGALAGFTGIRLREEPEALAELERRFNTPRDKLRDNLRRQTLVPERGTWFKNPVGTAVGLVFEPVDSVIVALPGPPRELQPMVTNELVPYLRGKFGVRSPGSSLTVRFVGVGQSQIDQTMREHVPMPPDVIVGSSFEGSRVDFTFALAGSTPKDTARLKDIEAGLRKHLGDYFYADDGATLEELVVKRLSERKATIGLVEIGTGGRLAAALHGVRGSEGILHWAHVAPTEERMKALLGITKEQWSAWTSGPERLKGLAEATLKPAGELWVLCVGPVSQEEGRSRGVLVGIKPPDADWVIQRVALQGTGETAHANLTTQILDRLRRLLPQ